METLSRGEDVDLPGLGRARIELVGETSRQEIEAAVYRAMRSRDLELTLITAERYEAERAVRTLAAGVRDPADHAQPFGAVEEWGALHTDVINAAWQVYGDVRERLDPLSEMAVLAEVDRVAIEAAVKKKAPDLLRSFGVAKLSAWLASTDVQLPTSPTPSSPASESPPG